MFDKTYHLICQGVTWASGGIAWLPVLAQGAEGVKGSDPNYMAIAALITALSAAMSYILWQSKRNQKLFEQLVRQKFNLPEEKVAAK